MPPDLTTHSLLILKDMWPLEWAWRYTWPADKGPNDYIPNPPLTDLSKYYDRGLRMGNLAYQLSNSFGGGLLDPATPLSWQVYR